MSVAEAAERVPPVPARWRERARGHLRGYLTNPLLTRDLRSFLRGPRPLALQAGYLGIAMVPMALGALLCHSQRSSHSYYVASYLPGYGWYMFVGCYVAQVVLLALITVAYGAGAITMEHEKRTYDMLAMATLTSAEIIGGKVLAIVALCAVLLFTSLPLAALCLMLGGVSPGQILLSYGLLCCALPLWASGCVLLSTLLPRTITSYVVCMVSMAGVMFITTMLGLPNEAPIGMMNPILSITPEDFAGFALLHLSFPAWITPPPLYALFTALCLVTAAEALPLHRPRRSTTLRLLVLGSAFLTGFLVYAALFDNAFTHGGNVFVNGSTTTALTEGLALGLVVAWAFAGATVPLFTSYPPPADAYARPLSWLLAPVSMRHWFERDTRVGWRSVLVSFAVAALAVVLVLLLAQRAYGLPPWTSEQLAFALFAVLLYALSLFAYAVWGSALAFLLRDRRIAGIVAVLLFLAINLLAVCHDNDPGSFRRVKPLAHPAVLDVSPISPADALLGATPSHLWPELWADGRYTVLLPLAYQLVFAATGLLYLRRAARLGRALLPPAEEGNL